MEFEIPQSSLKLLLNVFQKLWLLEIFSYKEADLIPSYEKNIHIYISIKAKDVIIMSFLLCISYTSCNYKIVSHNWKISFQYLCMPLSHWVFFFFANSSVLWSNSSKIMLPSCCHFYFSVDVWSYNYNSLNECDLWEVSERRADVSQWE